MNIIVPYNRGHVPIHDLKTTYIYTRRTLHTTYGNYLPMFAHMLKMIDHGKGGPTIWEHK